MSNNNKASIKKINENKNCKKTNIAGLSLCLESLSVSTGSMTANSRSNEASCDDCVKEEEIFENEAGAVACTQSISNVSKSEEDSAWLAMQMCNNNLLVESSCLASNDSRDRHAIDLNKWGVGEDEALYKVNSYESKEKQFGSKLEKIPQSIEEKMDRKASPEKKETVDLDYEYAAAAAAEVYSPPNQSNHTSLNNSTENLSYEEMLLLDNDNAESEASINSDDCVYAYRGNGDELEFAILNTRKVKDDEMDFLEMDYEPDPSSEVEYGDININARSDVTQPHSNALLLQRDSCHINSNGRHSANVTLRHTPTTINQRHFSSPTEDLQASANTLQTQAMLTKNFARISLHLDQIKNDTNDETDYELENLKANGVRLDKPMVASSAQSLPSTLNAYIDEGTNPGEENQEYAKVTGAKPKRLSRFSSTSSNSSKASTKSRNSLRSTITPANLTNLCFDERSASCNDFRSAPLGNEDPSFEPNKKHNFTDQSSNDDSCLDCLEKEFLANTIGKEVDTYTCVKCHKRRNNAASTSTTSYNRRNDRCRSGSPAYFMEYDYPRDEMYFDEYSPYTYVQYIGPQRNMYAFDDEMDMNFEPFSIGSIENGIINQRRKKRDNLKKEQMLKTISLTDTEIKLSTLNLSEEIIVLALDKFQILYNADLIKMYFKNRLSSNAQQNAKNFRNLYQFFLFESKKNCNHPKLKRLIESATKKQIEVQFKEDPTIAQPEMVSVKVADILSQWAMNKNLEVLKHFDNRFAEANLMGKVANIIRQAQQYRSSTRRPLPEYLSIPQFYPSGYLTLIKKC